MVKGIANIESSSLRSSAFNMGKNPRAENQQGNLELQVEGNSIQKIVSAVEQITTAVQEISREVNNSTTLVSETVEQTQRSERSVQSLIDSAGSIGQVVSLIDSVAAKINMLALNATIEAARAGEAGKGFSVVAGEVKSLANQTTQATLSIKEKIATVHHVSADVIKALHGLGEAVLRVNDNCSAIAASTEEQTVVLSSIANQAQDISKQFGQRDEQRLVEMSQTLVQLIVRNLYERTADVRWWATDKAFYRCLQTIEDKKQNRSNAGSDKPEASPSTWRTWFLPKTPVSNSSSPNANTTNAIDFAKERLEIINRFYSVYLNLVLVDCNGKVIATSKNSSFPQLVGADLSSRAWFRNALKTQSGDQYVVDDIYRDPLHSNRSVAVYATAVRERGDLNGKPIGVLGVYFDWDEQSRVIVNDEPNLSKEEWERSRVLLLDGSFRVIADSKGGHSFSAFPLIHRGKQKGSYIDNDGNQVAFAKTIGYQEYDGLGWYGVIVQRA